MDVVRANGVEVAYERVGDGPPLVFVHGATLDSRMWQPQLAGLADEFTVVAWDEPGAGRSSDVPSDFLLADYASCLAALIEALALGPAHVAGLSWGGTVALELYRHHPEHVATLICVDTYAGWKGSLPEEEVQARVEGVRRMMAAADGVFDPTLPGLFAGDPPAEFMPLLEAMAADVRPESMRTALLVMAEADQRDLLPRITVPALLIWGELDARSPLTVARQFEQAIPDAKLVVLPGAGHVSNLEQPERFNEAVREFCRDHSQTRAEPVVYECPVCRHAGLTAKPYERWPPPAGVELVPPYEAVLGRPSYEVCPRCGFEFGNDDNPGTAEPLSFDDYRRQWETDGRPWFAPPASG